MHLAGNGTQDLSWTCECQYYAGQVRRADRFSNHDRIHKDDKVSYPSTVQCDTTSGSLPARGIRLSLSLPVSLSYRILHPLACPSPVTWSAHLHQPGFVSESRGSGGRTDTYLDNYRKSVGPPSPLAARAFPDSLEKFDFAERARLTIGSPLCVVCEIAIPRPVSDKNGVYSSSRQDVRAIPSPTLSPPCRIHRVLDAKST